MLKSPESRFNNIDALRLILALLVLFSHSFPLGSGSEEFEPLIWLSGGQSTLGGLSVAWFFVLSGYLISQSWERSSTVWSFLKKRVARIYPGFIVAAAVCIWVIVPMSSPEGSRAYSWRVLADNIRPILLLKEFTNPDAFVNNPVPKVVNGSLWSISYEFKCYLGVVALGLTTLLRRRWLVLGLFLMALTLGFISGLSDLKPDWKFLKVAGNLPNFRSVTFYLAGVVAYLFREHLRADRRLAFLALLGLVVGAVTPLGFRITLPTFGTYLLFYLAFTTDWKWHNAGKYGDFSYGIYLYAWPIQQFVMMKLGRTVNPLVLFGLAFIPTVLAGVLSWYLVERRFLRKAHQKSAAPPVVESTKLSRSLQEPQPSSLG